MFHSCKIFQLSKKYHPKMGIQLFAKVKNFHQSIYKSTNHNAAEKTYCGCIENIKG